MITATNNTINNDSNDLNNGPHLTAYVWNLFQYTNNVKNDWNQNLRKICAIKAAEEFFYVQRYTLAPSKTAIGIDYLIFKEGIDPEWTHPANAPGGVIEYYFYDNDRQTPLDNCWDEIQLMIIGNQSDFCDEINGCIVNKRWKRDSIRIWINNTKIETIEAIHSYLKQYIPTIPKYLFTPHQKKLANNK